MLKLCGFAASNYYNVVKVALLEKGVPFEEVAQWPTEINAGDSPLQKVPYIVTENGPLSESTVILEYLEDRYPDVPLLPKDPYAAAKVREIIRYSDLHLELVARQVYGEVLMGAATPEPVKRSVEKQLRRNVAAFMRIARFSPYVAGDTFTLADCAAVAHLPMVSMASKKVWGEDFLAGTPAADYVKRMHERPAFAKVRADSKANFEPFVNFLKSLYAPKPAAPAA